MSEITTWKSQAAVMIFFQGTMPTSLGRLEPVSIEEQERVQELTNYVRNRA